MIIYVQFIFLYINPHFLSLKIFLIMSSPDLYSEIPLPYENVSNESFSFDVLSIPLPPPTQTTIDSCCNTSKPQYIPSITTTTFRRDGDVVTPVCREREALTTAEKEYDEISKNQRCSFDIWDDDDDGLTLSKSTIPTY